ncbi:transcriptional activator haa1 [Cytospora paraplurivora]|uniref:Transcriptional activator haa1 n=1 Tax=Cytospora paraplurivora TaxID=2898453 RepID=A0AAN9U9R2_9PEZI
MRRSKSAHVKCDCGEKTSKCIHLQATVEGHRESCCCNHGGRCTCSLKKDLTQLDTVPESDSDNETSASSSSNAKVSRTARNRRSRASTQNSDGMLTFDENGHHKPTYKHTKASQKSGPYQLTRGHSTQSTGSASNISMEDLGNGSSASSTASAPQAQGQRATRSESASPLMTGSSSLPMSTNHLPRLDLSSVSAWGSAPFISDSFDLFGGSLEDHDQPIFSAGLNQPSVDWSHYGLDFANKDLGSFAPSSYSQAPSFAGFDQPPTLTSGEVSEVEDFIPPTGDDFDPIGTFSRTNTSSTGFSLDPSQDGLMGAIEMSGTGFDFAKVGKEDGSKFAASAATLIGEETGMAAAVASSGVAGFENDPIFWMGDVDYSGLTAVNDVPDANGPNFWDVQ